MTDLRVSPDQLPEPEGETEVPSVIRRRRLQTEPLGHVESLDGLRAVAVLAVLSYHAHFTWIAGGFLSLSMFFALSGFLITSLLLREYNASDSRTGIDLRRFWSRRFRRLLPASWTTMGVILAMGLFGIWNSDQLRKLRGDIPFAIAEIINWHFIAQGRTYGDDFLAPSPLEHFWSLAVEQQFYVILPLLVVGIMAVGRRQPMRKRVGLVAFVFLGLAAFSAISNGWYARTSIDRAYFGTDSRMAEMLIGGLLACATLRRLRFPDGVIRWVLMGVGFVALATTGWLWHIARLDASWVYPWGMLSAAALTAAVIISAIQGGPLGWVLSLAPLVWLGRISYGVYLLHWPIFLWLTPARVGLSQWPLFGLRLAVTIVLAVVLFHVVENPIRRGERLKGRSAPVVAAVAAVAMLAGTAWVTRGLPPPNRLQQATSKEGATPTTVPPPVVKVAVVGDQMAGSLGEQLGSTKGLDVTVAVVPDCGIAVGGSITLADGRVERDVNRCGKARETWLSAVRTAQPDVVMVMATMRDANARRLGTKSDWTGPGDPGVDQLLSDEFALLSDELAETGAEVVLVTAPHVNNSAVPSPIPDPEPNPDPAQEELLQIERSQFIEGNPGPGFRENDPASTDRVNQLLSEVAAKRSLRLFDLAAQTQQWSGGAFDPALRSADGVGFTADGGSKLGEWLLPMLRESQKPVLAPPPPVIAPDTPLPPAPPARDRRVVAPGEPAEVLVVGDSVAFAIGFGLEDWGRETGEMSAVTAAQFGCAIARGGKYKFQRDTRTLEARCDWANSYPGLIAGHRPDVVVVSSGVWEVVDRLLIGDDRFRHIGEADIDRFILGEFVAAIDTLGADGAHVVVLNQPHIESGLDKGETDLPESEPERMDRLNELLAEAVALRPGVATLIDLRGWLSGLPGGEMDPVKRSDGIHFSDDFTPTLSAWLGPEIMRIARGG